MRKGFLLSIGLLYVVMSWCQVLKPAAPETAGASSSRLQRIDKVLQEYVDNHYLAGATALVARDGKIIYYKSIGYSDAGKRTPLKNDAIYRIASQTKAITSVAVMMLFEQGKLLLDDAIGKYIPEFKNQQVLDKYNAADTTYTTVPAKRAVTIRDLLTHSSGIAYAQIGSPESNAIYYKNGIVGGIGVGKIRLADKMKILGKMPLFHQPGERWTYGLNTDLLGYLVEVISGMSLDDFLRKNIFDPLGMKDTYFYLPSASHNRLVTLHTEDTAGHVKPTHEVMKLNGEVDVDYPLASGTYYSGGGGLSSTTMDYSIFLQMLLNGGIYNGKRILSPVSVRMMTSNQFDKMGWGDTVMGLGFGVYTKKSESRSPLSEGSYEWGGMFSSSYWVDPKQKIVAQLFINQYPNTHGEIHDKFKVLVYQALEN